MRAASFAFGKGLQSSVFHQQLSTASTYSTTETTTPDGGQYNLDLGWGGVGPTRGPEQPGAQSGCQDKVGNCELFFLYRGKLLFSCSFCFRLSHL